MPVILPTGTFCAGTSSKVLKVCDEPPCAPNSQPPQPPQPPDHNLCHQVVFNQARPTGADIDPGMPSSHATNLFFIAMFLTMQPVAEQQRQQHGAPHPLLRWNNVGWLAASTLSYLRVRSGHHTWAQVGWRPRIVLASPPATGPATCAPASPPSGPRERTPC